MRIQVQRHELSLKRGKKLDCTADTLYSDLTVKKIFCMRWQAIVKAANQESRTPPILESSVESFGQSDSRSLGIEKADLSRSHERVLRE